MTTQIRLFQKFELSVERGQLKSCQICGNKFSVFVPEHQCKRCLRAVCSSCGTAKRDVYKPQMARKPHRLCKICNIQSTILIEYISANKLTFGSDSEIGRKWRKKIPKPVRDQSNTKHQRKFTVEIFNELWDAYNFSLREFIGLQTYLTGQAEVYKLINTVYQQLQLRGVEQKLENVILLIVFMLCYSSTDTCANLVEYLCNLKKSVVDHKQMLQTYLRALGIQQSESKKLNDYINYKCKQFLGPISINAVTAECSIHAITKAFQRQRIDQTYMLLAIVLQENWEMLLKNRADKKQCDFLIIRNCNMTNYIEKYKSLVSVKVAQFSSVRASLKNIPVPEEFDKNKLPESFLKQDIEQSQSSFSLKVNKYDPEPVQPVVLKKVESSSVEEDLRAKALRNIARIKQENEKNRRNNSDDSIQQAKEQKIKNQKIKEQKIEHSLIKDKTDEFEGSFFHLKESEPVKLNGIKKQTKQKQIKNENYLPAESEPIVYYQREQCAECEKKLGKLQDIEEELKNKIEELQSTTRQLTSSKNETHRLRLQIKQLQDQLRVKKQEKNQESPEQLERVKQEVTEVTQKYNNIMKQLLKYQRQNKSLKNEIEQMSLNNKILKSKLEQSSMGLGLSVKVSQNEQELTRMNQLMKKSIEGKNKQLQTLSKKNKELLAQLQQFSNSRITSSSKESQKTTQLQKEKDDLMSKIKDLGDRIVRQQEEKLNLSSQLFQLKRSHTLMPEYNLKESQQDEKSEGIQRRPSECFIF